MNYLGITVQVIVAVCIVVLFHKGTTMMMVSNRVVVDNTRRVATPIFKGWVNGVTFSNRKFNSFNDFATNYRYMPRSINRAGGAQFSFSLWTRFNDVSDINLKNKVLFMYGDPTKYGVTRTINEPLKASLSTDTLNDYIIMCPMLKFSDDGNGLVIKFNTNEHIHNSMIVEKIRSSDEAIRHNLLAMLPGKWALWTVTFEESLSKVGGADSEPGIMVKMYVNEVLYFTDKMKGSLRLNRGYVTVLPEPINHSMLADLTYYNWALNQGDVTSLVRKGMSKKAYTDLDDDMNFNAPDYITEYNKLEIYNL